MINQYTFPRLKAVCLEESCLSNRRRLSPTAQHFPFLIMMSASQYSSFLFGAALFLALRVSADRKRTCEYWDCAIT